MANPEQGDIAVVVGDKTYTFCFSIAAICALEDKTGRGIFDIASELSTWSHPTDVVGGVPVPRDETAEQVHDRMSRIRMGLCRDVFWAGFQEHHPELSIAEVGRIMPQLGGLLGAMQIIDRGLAAAFPRRAEVPARNPRKRTR